MPLLVSVVINTRILRTEIYHDTSTVLALVFLA